MKQEYTLKKNTLVLNEEYDVIVCGGGPAGCTAAISAAREGAKTLLLESTGMLGGMATNGLVNSWTPVHDGIRNIHGGLAGKIITALRAVMPHVDSEKWNWLPIDFEQLKLLYDRMVTEAGADVLFHSCVCGVEMKDDRNIDVIIVANKAGMTAYRAKVFIDCTGDADVYAWAGKEYIKGDENGLMQAGTMCFVVSGIDEEAFAHMNDPYYTGVGRKSGALLNKIIADGKYDIPDDHMVPRKIAPNTYSFNAGQIFGIDATDPVSVSEGCMRGRVLARTLKDAFTEYAPAFKDSYLVQTAPTLGLRESRRIIGDYTFTMEDYFARRSFPDEVLRGRYPIDVHEEYAGQVRNTLVEFEKYGEGESYGVPYRCMCPRDLDNLLVAGRTISSDRMSNGSLRVMSCCLNEGEAVGMAAKFACETPEVNIHKVDTQRLRKRLIEEGAYLPRLETDTFPAK